MGLPPRTTSLATFTLKSNGTPVPGTFRIVALEIQRELNRVPSARVVLHDGDAARQNFPISEGPELAPGAEIEIGGGYNRQETRLFKGVVTRQRIEAGRGRDTFLHIEAKDPLFRATLARQSVAFVDSSESDFIRASLGGFIRQVEIPDTPVVEAVTLHQTTAWDFAVQRAEAQGMVCDTDGETLRFFEPDPGQSPAATFAFGQHIHRMDLEQDAETPFAGVSFSAWNPADQELTNADADTAPAAVGDSAAELSAVADATAEPLTAAALDENAVDTSARARLTRSRLASLRGIIEVQGAGDVVPGQVIALEGMGSRFSGRGFVSGVRHEIGRGDWMTSIQVGLDPRMHYQRRPFAAAPAAAGEIPPVHGLHIGVVSALEGDPAGEDRIEVRVETNRSVVWARIAAFDAGSDRGGVFRPEIDDEVVMGFLDNDPRHPVVLGALHSSAHPAPIPGSDDNHQKGYVTRAGMKLVFDDDKPSVTVETPGGAKLVLDDDTAKVELVDQNGNMVTMESSGLTLEAAADLTIKAGGNISIEGVNVDVQASASATVNGSASATLEASGQTTVKGAVVMIN